MSYINTDIPELKGYDTGVVLANLKRICHRMDAEWESAVAHLYELAEAARHDASGDPETMETILRALAADAPAASHVLPANRRAVDELTRYLGLHQRLILYRAIAESGRRTHHTPPTPKGRDKGRRPLLSHAAKGRVAYMPNAFADQAYMRFSHHLSDKRGGAPCRASACHSFAEACEEVSRGLCEYCILPVENSADGKLTGFSRLIIRHHLFITAVCDVENHTLTDSNSTRFALLTLAPDLPAWFLTFTPHPRYLELLHTSASSPSLTDLMVAATFCGLTLCRVDTLSAPDEPLPTCVVWHTHEVTDIDLHVFLGYLTLEVSEDTVMGLYDQI